MNREKIKKTFQRLVTEGNEGFTLTLEGNEFKPDQGYAVAWRTCDNLDEALDHASPQQFIGYWIHPETKETYVEVVDVFNDILQAFVNGIARNQKAIYNFKDDDVIDLTKNHGD